MKTSIILPIPPKATATVALGDLVTPHDTVWSFSSTSEDRTIHLARILKVSPDKIEKYLKVVPGDKLKEGEVIAVKKSLLHKIMVKSPQDAVLKNVDIERGTVTLEVSQDGSKLSVSSPGGVSGKVIRISPEEIEIETEGHVYTGKKGSGGEIQGILHVVALDRVTLFNLEGDLENAILLVSNLDEEVLTKLDVMGVVGLIMLENELSDTSFPWLSVGKETHEKLKKHDGKKVIIRPMQKIAVIM